MPSGGRETVHVEVDGERRLISRSPALQRVFRQIQQMATADVSVLITGETGTGKELVGPTRPQAEPPSVQGVRRRGLQHGRAHRERGAFTGADRQRVGVFELADAATLFLDEIANLALEMIQACQTALGARKTWEMRDPFRERVT